jgi:hypothetical protein
VASHNILSKTDRALVAYLISIGVGTAADTDPAKRSVEKALPCTVCYSQRATLISPYSGVYEVTCAIMIKTDPSIDFGETEADPKNVSEDRVAATFDAFFDQLDSAGDKLAAAITAAARASSNPADSDLEDFTIQDISVTGVEAGFDQRGSWLDTLNLELLVCPKDVS